MIGRQVKLILSLLTIVLFVIIFGYLLGAWTGFPKGADAYARITRIVYILDFFPHVSWQYHWSNGMPTFKTEAPFFYYLGALIAKLFSLPPEKPLIIVGFLTFVFIGVGIFGYVSSLTRNYAAGLLAAILALSSYSVWDWMVYGGIYPRIFAVGLSMMSLWLVVRFLQSAKEAPVFPKWPFFWLVLFLATTMITHVLMAFFAWVTIFLIIFSFPLPRKTKIKCGFLIFGTAFSLAGFFFLPLVLGFGGETFHFFGLSSPVSPTPFFYLFEFIGIGPFVLPFLLIGSVFVCARLKSHPEEKSRFYSLIFAPLLMFLLFSVYSLIGHTGLPGKYYYVGGFIPVSGTLFMTVYGSILIGVLFVWLGKYSKLFNPKTFLILALLVALSSILIGIPLNKTNSRYLGPVDTGLKAKKNDVYLLQQILKFPDKENYNYRFSACDAAEAVWFNVAYKIPQVRDYYGQGVLYPDWRYWHEQAVWNQDEFTLDEARVAFDWFATRWFSTYEVDVNTLKDLSTSEFLAQSKNRYLREPGFKLISHGRFRLGVQAQFEIENPSPILSATNSTPVLFIGDKAGYNLFFRNLTLINLNSQRIIPVSGKRFIDDYKLSDLTPFKTIALYNYRYKQKEKAHKLLQDYVYQGGNLIWEVAGSPDEEGELPEPAPVTQISKKEVKEDWDFKALNNEITSGVNFTSFSPLIYNDDFWKLSITSTPHLRPWAKGTLGKNGQLIAAAGNYGQGKVVWTGFNFPYHIDANRNREEAKFLARIIDWLETEGKPKEVVYGIEFINPEKRTIEIKEPTKGILFKESYYPNWRAYLLDLEGKKKNLEIRLAGPAMMYVLLPNETRIPAKVVFEYKFSLIEKLGILVSFLTFLVLLFYLVGRLPKPRFLSRFLKEISGWWDKEEG